MPENIVADTSFFVCYESDLKKRTCLLNFMNIYTFHIGEKIRRELPLSLANCKEFCSLVKDREEPFIELVKPLISRSERHKNDGEYEAIGIAYHLNEHYSLKYLIIDEKVAYNFTYTHFPTLQGKLTRSIGFVKKSCMEDKIISHNMALHIFNCMKRRFEEYSKENKGRPCSIDGKVYSNILIPSMKEIEVDRNNGRL